MSQNIFSLEGLVSWLEKQPSKTTYMYCSVRGCLIFQYLNSFGLVRSVAATFWRGHDRETHPLPQEFNDVAQDGVHTYGAALERARNMLAKQKEF